MELCHIMIVQLRIRYLDFIRASQFIHSTTVLGTFQNFFMPSKIIHTTCKLHTTCLCYLDRLFSLRPMESCSTHLIIKIMISTLLDGNNSSVKHYSKFYLSMCHNCHRDGSVIILDDLESTSCHSFDSRSSRAISPADNLL